MKFNADTRNKVLIFAGVILIIFLGLILGFLAAELYTNFNAQREANKTQLEENVQVVADKNFLEDNAEVIFRRIYTKCDETSTEKRTLDSNYAGKTKAEIEELYDEWSVEEFSPDRIVLEKKIDSYSPKYYKLGVYTNEDGIDMVAVYTYDVEGKEVLDSVTSTPLELIYDDQREKLIEGIMVDDREELYNLLENYDE